MLSKLFSLLIAALFALAAIGFVSMNILFGIATIKVFISLVSGVFSWIFGY